MLPLLPNCDASTKDGRPQLSPGRASGGRSGRADAAHGNVRTGRVCVSRMGKKSCTEDKMELEERWTWERAERRKNVVLIPFLCTSFRSCFMNVFARVCVFGIIVLNEVEYNIGSARKNIKSTV